MTVRFANRREAGKELAKKLRHFAFHSDVVILALPRGGVPVGYEVAAALHVPLHVFVVRKLGVPGQEEYAMGAIASGGTSFVNQAVIQQLGICEEEVDGVIEREIAEIRRREKLYGADHALEIDHRTIILIDDGLATGSTMRAAIRALRERHPRSIVVAVPVGPRDTLEDLAQEADDVVVLRAPSTFYAVGEWYEDFSQTTDDEVRALLQEAEANANRADKKPLAF